jgi:hypothetical protein
MDTDTVGEFPKPCLGRCTHQLELNVGRGIRQQYPLLLTSCFIVCPGLLAPPSKRPHVGHDAEYYYDGYRYDYIQRQIR